MNLTNKLVIGLAASLMPMGLYAFDSGSTGADGALNPTADIELQLPPSGIFNYTTIDVSAGVTLTFAKNAANTSMILLASGDVNIAGVVDISGADSADIAGVDVTDDGMRGVGGPGGFDGGRGGFVAIDGSSNHEGGAGLGPGGGQPGTVLVGSRGCGGGGAGFDGVGGRSTSPVCDIPDVRGPAYGTLGTQYLIILLMPFRPRFLLF